MQIPELLGLLSRYERESESWLVRKISFSPVPCLEMDSGKSISLESLDDLMGRDLASVLERPEADASRPLPDIIEKGLPKNTWIETLLDIGSNYWPFEDPHPSMSLISISRSDDHIEVIVESSGKLHHKRIPLDGSFPQGIPYEFRDSLSM